MKKGIFWIVFALITTAVFVLLAILISPEKEWCNESLGAGACELYNKGESCYCIDEDSTYVEEGRLQNVYEHSEAHCHSLNGSLAIVQERDLLIWLAKRLYIKGIDNGFIALRKLGSKWFWIEKDGSTVAADQLPWRPGVVRDPFHKYATINVQTIYKIDNQTINDDYGEYGYKSYNYDYFVEHDSNYQWFGIATSDNTADYTRGAHFICHCTYDPLRAATTSDSLSGHTSDPVKSLHEQCACELNKQIVLSNLEETDTFSSPRYPNNYCSDANCKWTINTKQGLVIKLDWIVFSLEKDMDFVYVYDGEDTQSPLVESCTTNHCSQRMSSTSSMVVHFQSDHVTTQIGFKARVTAVENDECYCSPSTVVKLVNLGETFTINSPMFPRPYCANHNCKWTVIGPENLGVQLLWYQFSIEPHADAVQVYYDSGKRANCDGDECPDGASVGEELQVQFTSDHHHSGHTGFSAVAKAVQNYCDKDQLKIPSIGTMSFSKIRDDGYIPMYESAILTCPSGHKVIDTPDSMNDAAVCVAPHQWDKTEFEHCVKVCELDFSTANRGDQIHGCDSGDQWLIPSGQTVVQQIRDFSQSSLPAASTLSISCVDGHWDPEPPLCHHRMEGIVTMGGQLVVGSGLSLYLPAWHASQKLQIGLFGQITVQHTGGVLPNGQILIVAVNKDTILVDVGTGTVSKGPQTNAVRMNAAAATSDHMLLVCGGGDPTYNSCEEWRNNSWWFTEPMLISRAHHAMVSVGNDFYVMGGYTHNYHQYEFLSSVEVYSIGNDSWHFVADMSRARAWLSASQIDDVIYVCGGGVGNEGLDGFFSGVAQTTCESYHPDKNRWTPIAGMNSGRRSFALVSYGGRLFALGGQAHYDDYNEYYYRFDNYTEPMKSVESYDVIKVMWTKEPDLLESFHDFLALVVSFEVTQNGCLIVESDTFC